MSRLRRTTSGRSRHDRDQEQVESPTARIKKVRSGAAGRIDYDDMTYLVEGRGSRDVFIVGIRGAGFFDKRVSGPNRFKKLVKRALHRGGSFTVEGRDSWPARFRDIQP